MRARRSLAASVVRRRCGALLPLFVVACSWLAVLSGAARVAASGSSSTPQSGVRGFALLTGAWSDPVVGVAQATSDLTMLHDVGGRMVSIGLTLRMDSFNASSIYADPSWTPSLAQLSSYIGGAHDRGLSVALKLFISFDKAGSYWLIRPANLTAWFQSYEEQLMRYAAFAQANAVEVLIVGAELMGLTTSGEPAVLTGFLHAIQSARSVFSGTMTYAAMIPEYQHIPSAMWMALDAVGIDAYYPSADSPTTPLTVATMAATYRQHTQGLYAFWNQTINRARPIWFTEAGCAKVNGAAATPWIMPTAEQCVVSAGTPTAIGAPNATVQALYFEAMFDVLRTDLAEAVELVLIFSFPTPSSAVQPPAHTPNLCSFDPFGDANGTDSSTGAGAAVLQAEFLRGRATRRWVGCDNTQAALPSPAALAQYSILPLDVSDAAIAFDTLAFSAFVSTGAIEQAEFQAQLSASRTSINNNSISVAERSEIWAEQWTALSALAEARAQHSSARADNVTASSMYLRASSYLQLASRFQPPLRADVRQSYAHAVDLFAAGIALSTPRRARCDRVRIPYANGDGVDYALHGYWCWARGVESAAPSSLLPLVVGVNGMDGSVEWSVHTIGLPMADFGFHTLVFEGPGQGLTARSTNLTFRADWEVVVGQVLSFALHNYASFVDVDRLVLWGESFGGELSARAFAMDPRFRALVANGGVLDFYQSMACGVLAKLGGRQWFFANNAADDARLDARCNSVVSQSFDLSFLLSFGDLGFRTGRSLTALFDAWMPFQVAAMPPAANITDRHVFVFAPQWDQLTGNQSSLLWSAWRPFVSAQSLQYQPDPSTGLSMHCGVGNTDGLAPVVSEWLRDVLDLPSASGGAAAGSCPAPPPPSDAPPSHALTRPMMALMVAGWLIAALALGLLAWTTAQLRTHSAQQERGAHPNYIPMAQQ